MTRGGETMMRRAVVALALVLVGFLGGSAVGADAGERAWTRAKLQQRLLILEETVEELWFQGVQAEGLLEQDIAELAARVAALEASS
jgi:hypothetical protein